MCDFQEGYLECSNGVMFDTTLGLSRSPDVPCPSCNTRRYLEWGKKIVESHRTCRKHGYEGPELWISIVSMARRHGNNVDVALCDIEKVCVSFFEQGKEFVEIFMY